MNHFKRTQIVRYAYSVTAALLAGGAALSFATGFPAGAQVAQNDDASINRVVPRSGAPASFADLTAQLQPAVVNISTRQRRSKGCSVDRARTRRARRSRWVRASSSAPTAMS